MITPASIRNRNPGSQYPGKSAKKFGATSYETLRSKDGVHKIATFPTSVHGAAALFDLLSRKPYLGATLEKAITTWCGGFYAPTYLAVLEKHGIPRETVLTPEFLRNPTHAIQLAKAMAWQEAGRDYPMSDLEWLSAHQMAFYGGVAPAWAPENDVPSPRPESRRSAAIMTYGPPVALAGTGAAPLVAQVPQAVSDTIGNLAQWQATGMTTMTLLSDARLLGSLIVAGGVYWLVMKLIPWWRG